MGAAARSGESGRRPSAYGRGQPRGARVLKVVGDSMQQACAAHRRYEVEKEKQDLDVMKKAGTQVNEVKDLKAFQALMKPVYASVEQQVGKEFMDRLAAAAQAAR